MHITRTHTFSVVLLGVCDVITRTHTFSVVLLGVCDVITRAHMFSVVLLGVCGAHYKGTHVFCGFAWRL